MDMAVPLLPWTTWVIPTAQHIKLSSAAPPNSTSTCCVSESLTPGAGQCTPPDSMTQSPGLLTCTVGTRRSVHRVVWILSCLRCKYPPPVPDHRDNSPHTQQVHPTPGCKAALHPILKFPSVNSHRTLTLCQALCWRRGARVMLPPGCPCGETGLGHGGSAHRRICSGGLEVLGGPWGDSSRRGGGHRVLGRWLVLGHGVGGEPGQGWVLQALSLSLLWLHLFITLPVPSPWPSLL